MTIFGFIPKYKKLLKPHISNISTAETVCLLIIRLFVCCNIKKLLYLKTNEGLNMRLIIQLYTRDYISDFQFKVTIPKIHKMYLKDKSNECQKQNLKSYFLVWNQGQRTLYTEY